MPLAEEMIAQGTWLFRWRSYLPLALMTPVVLSWFADSPQDQSRIHLQLVGGALAFAGLAMRVLVVAHVPRRTSGRHTRRQVAVKLNTDGLYSLVRHPLYVGNALVWVGAAVFASSWGVAAAVLLAYALYYERVALAEEHFLRGAFGAAYESWAARTPAFLPRTWRWRPPALPFSPRRVLAKESGTLCAIVVGLALLGAARDFIVTGRIAVHAAWWLAASSTFLLFVAARWLRWHTSVLAVTDR